MLGIELIPWQRWLLIHALELLKDGTFRFRTVLILVARQNGKTTLVEVKNLWKMFVLRVPMVIGTAQNLDISEESWDKAVEIVESIPELAAEIAHVDRTNGKKALRLVHGSRWKIAAASRKGGRGLSGDDVNLDELREHQTWDSWAAVTKTTMARRNPQVFGYSNAGDDRSIVLNDLQAKGRAVAEHPDGADTTLGLFEWSAPDDVKCTCERSDGQPHQVSCRLQDRVVWAQANPSLGYTVSAEGLASALATDPEGIFRTECLCQRVPSLAEDRIISMERWAELADPASRRQGDVAFAFDVEPNRGHASIGVFGMREDGAGHVELIDYRPGTSWVPARLAELKASHRPIAIGMDSAGPAGSLLPDLAAVGITPPEDPDHPRRGDLAVLGARDAAGSTGQILDAVATGTLRHIDQAELTNAVDGAKLRPLGDASAFARRRATTDIGPLIAISHARYVYVTRIDKVQPAESDPGVWWV